MNGLAKRFLHHELSQHKLTLPKEILGISAGDV